MRHAGCGLPDAWGRRREARRAFEHVVLQSPPWRPPASATTASTLSVADPVGQMTGDVRPCCYRAMLLAV
jgi:hypothetical protein